MKFRPEFEVEVVRGALLNRNLISLDTCVGELLREEHYLIIQRAMFHEAIISEPEPCDSCICCSK